MAIYHFLFFFKLVKCAMPHATSEAIAFESLATQNDHLNLSFVKDKHAVGKKMAWNAIMLKYIIVIYFASEYILLQKILGEVLFAKGPPVEEIKLWFSKNLVFLINIAV